MSDESEIRGKGRVHKRAAKLLATRRRHPQRWRLIGVSLVLALLIIAWLIVYASGGTRFAY